MVDELNDKRRECGAIALAHVGTKYDYNSLFKQIVCRVSVDAKRFFCSEYFAYVWNTAGVPFCPKTMAPRPGDLTNNVFLKTGVEL